VALRLGTYPARADLILNPTTYRTGGINLGLIGTAHVAGFSKETMFYTDVNTGGQFTDAETTAINLIYRVVILDQSNALMEALFGETGNIFEFFAQYKLGHPSSVNPALEKKLLVRPTLANKPHLYMPRGYIFDIGPMIWDRRQKVYDSTYMMVASLWDKDRDAAFHYGDEAALEAI
jgi:hypothetical protein